MRAGAGRASIIVRRRAATTVLAAASALILAACGGGDDDTTTTTTGATTTGAGDSSQVCAAYAQVKSAGKAVRELDRNSSPTEVGQATSDVATSVKALSSAASEASGETKARIQAAVSSYQSELEGLSLAERLAALGTAVSKLENSFSETARQLKCDK
jgi:hypothetical protein